MPRMRRLAFLLVVVAAIACGAERPATTVAPVDDAAVVDDSMVDDSMVAVCEKDGGSTTGTS